MARTETSNVDPFASRFDSLAVWPAPDGSIQLQPHRLPVVPDSVIDHETLWLARCIFSETKRPEEQELIAWVVRNRVESAYRGKSSYRDVVLDPFQFSAFNVESTESTYYSSIPLQYDETGWQRALSIAYYVRHARPQYRPFSAETLHFYSQQSMIGQREPVWARGLTPIRPPEHFRLDDRRFRFFAGIS
ncbi:MAG: cell wall hydrolase [Rhodothermales bacterium]|nr:cell wall hydrolase [Rhodothermales bacterium]